MIYEYPENYDCLFNVRNGYLDGMTKGVIRQIK